MAIYKNVFHWWWAWSSDRFEHYLERLHQSGWAATSTSMGHTMIQFMQVAPRKVRYCLDYQHKVTDEYLTIMQDDGWQMIGNSTGWIIWSKPYDTERPDIFTDKLSLIDRNKRLLRMCGIIAITQIPIAINVFASLMSSDGTFSMFLMSVIVSTQVLLWYGIIRLLLYNKRLKNVC